jgi:hypothetical protein
MSPPSFDIPKECKAGIVVNEGPNFRVEVKMVPVPEIGIAPLALLPVELKGFIAPPVHSQKVARIPPGALSRSGVLRHCTLRSTRRAHQVECHRHMPQRSPLYDERLGLGSHVPTWNDLRRP